MNSTTRNDQRSTPSAARAWGWLSPLRESRLLLALLLAFVSTACAQSVGDIDRTQPNLLAKADFEGDWYVRQTVVGVPLTSSFSFVGETGQLEMIRWEVREDMLVGYRAYESIPGSGQDVESAPIVAYPILDHADVQREYNAQTGEQTNVISENTTDRPWNERKYMRVDWASPQVTNFQFISSPSDMRVESSSYVPENENDEDSFYLEHDDEGRANYFDFTERMFVQPGINGCILNALNNEIGDCAAAEIRVRTSFAKVDEEREATYAPLDYDDVRQGDFGLFRTERPSYDRRRGVTYSGLSLLGNRHDFWVASLRDGELIPYQERTLRPVTYYLSPDFPQELIATTELIAEEYDAVFKEVVSVRLAESIEQVENRLTEAYGQSCLFCLDANEEGQKRLGDLRYSFIAWVDEPQLIGPLGYGPSSANPETGRLVSGMAYVYGAGVDSYAQRAKDMVDLINGNIELDDLVSGSYLQDEVLGRRPSLSGGERERFSELSLKDATKELLGGAHLESLEAVRTGDLPEASPGYLERQLAKLTDTDVETRLMDSEWLRALAPGLGLDPQGPFDADQLASLSPLQSSEMQKLSLRKQRQQLAERNNLWLRDFSDPTVIGLAIEAADQGLSGEELYQFLRPQIYRAVMLHEIGHTVGLRHNFGGSADALNYDPEYWEQRVSSLRAPETVADLLLMNCTEIDDANAQACADQQRGRMREYQYSSIMDYGAKFNSDFHGLGHYDRAALASAYGNLREVFTDQATANLPDGFAPFLTDVAQLPSPVFGSLYDQIHYTDLIPLFGDTDALQDRQWVPREDIAAEPGGYTLVPYIACYDEYVDASELCHRWDEGADPFEITMNWIGTYEDYYAFHALSRDMVGFSPVDTFQRVTSRFFLPLQNMYQHGLFSLSFTSDPLLSTYESLQMTAGFNLLASVLTTPRYGSYVLDGDVLRWVGYGTGAGDVDILPGVGRREFSRYDFSSGYNAFQRVAETGYYWDQLGALIALTNSDASLLGVGQDIDADLLSYSIPYYLLFQPQLDSLFSDIFLEQTLSFGPYLDGDTVRKRGLFDLNPAASRPDTAIPIAVSVPWTTRIRSVLFAMSSFKVNFDLSFVQGAQVALEGSGDVLTPAPNYEVLQFADPVSGRAYAAYYDPIDPSKRFVAAELMAALTPIAELYVTTDDEETFFQARSILQYGVENLEILRSLYNAFEYSL